MQQQQQKKNKRKPQTHNFSKYFEDNKKFYINNIHIIQKIGKKILHLL